MLLDTTVFYHNCSLYHPQMAIFYAAVFIPTIIRII